VTRVRLVKDPYVGLSVNGQVQNNLDAALSQFARISAVVFNASGRIVGGGYTYLDADPCARAARRLLGRHHRLTLICELRTRVDGQLNHPRRVAAGAVESSDRTYGQMAYASNLR